MEIVIWFVIGGLVGVICGRARGREGAGALLGMLLGPLGWLVILAGRDDRRKCQECRGVIDQLAKRCRHCGCETPTKVLVKCPACAEVCSMNERDLGTEMQCPVCNREYVVRSDLVVPR